jgi:hypothetical protein
MREIEKDKFVELVRAEYYRVDRAGKKRLLDELVERYHCHRKHAIRLLKKGKPGRKPTPKKRGPKPKYASTEVKSALRRTWSAMDFVCSKILKAAIPEWLPFVEKYHGSISEEDRVLLLQMSSSTIDRTLAPYRSQANHGRSGTKPGTLIRKEIPIRTGFWDETIPGFVEADTVAHCGGSLSGNFVWSITVTDIATTWTECRATWNKGSSGVIEQIANIEEYLPFALLGFDSDNGSEFLNWHLLRYFSQGRTIPINFTRSREYQKNDNAHVEQKNWSFPRHIFGYDRLGFAELVPLMNEVYSKEVSLLRNHFCPAFKLKERILVSSRHKRVYDQPKTPYKRILESEHISDEKKHELYLLHSSMDPIQLQHSLRKKIKFIFSELKRLGREDGDGSCLKQKPCSSSQQKVFEGMGESASRIKPVLSSRKNSVPVANSL